MEKIQNILFHLGRVWITGISFVVIAFFAREAFQTENGLPALRKLSAQKAFVMAEYEQVKKDRLLLEKRVDLMDASRVDPDMLEEQVRSKLGFVAKDEIILLD